MGKILKSLMAMFKGKTKEIDEKLVESNPEAILNQAIEEAKKKYLLNERKVADLISLYEKEKESFDNKVKSLDKIEEIINKSREENDTDSVNEGIALYKQREIELDEEHANLLDTYNDIEELRQFVIAEKQKIEKLEAEKVRIIAKNASANVKQTILDISSSINTGENSSSINEFDRVKDIIDNKSRRVSATKGIRDNGKSNSKFKGL